jgi:hypothetical protein
LDGLNVWIANSGSNNVTKLRASDGALQGIFTAGIAPGAAVQGVVGSTPFGITFDGANIWVTNINVGSVSKL